MVKFIILCFFLILNGCSSLKKNFVDCPKVIAPKKAAEVIVKSENKLPVYIGFRGIKPYCIKIDDAIEMEISVNIRAIRKETEIEDFVPVNISIVSTDFNNKEYERDNFSYSQFLLKGSRIVDRATIFDIKIPKGGQVYLGLK
tara:strand:- start:387 stop:815 length:429 start_codon:yes stop_codon:yes gene_type:complete